MNKKEMLQAIEHARKAHAQQIEKVKLLIEGKEVADLTPVSKLKCEFGHWLYADVQSMKGLLGVQFYENLDNIHEEWHGVYAKIYEMFIGAEPKGLFSKIFKKHKVSVLEYEKAKLYYTDLEQITNNLLKVLESSQRRLQALSESKFH